MLIETSKPLAALCNANNTQSIIMFGFTILYFICKYELLFFSFFKMLSPQAGVFVFCVFFLLLLYMYWFSVMDRC